MRFGSSGFSFWTNLTACERLWAPFGAQLRATGGPKIALLPPPLDEKSNETCENILENLVSEAFWKKVEKCENRAVERVILWFSLEASSKILALSRSENLMISGSKMISKIMKIWSFGRLGGAFLAVGGRIF